MTTVTTTGVAPRPRAAPPESSLGTARKKLTLSRLPTLLTTRCGTRPGGPHQTATPSGAGPGRKRRQRGPALHPQKQEVRAPRTQRLPPPPRAGEMTPMGAERTPPRTKPVPASPAFRVAVLPVMTGMMTAGATDLDRGVGPEATTPTMTPATLLLPPRGSPLRDASPRAWSSPKAPPYTRAGRGSSPLFGSSKRARPAPIRR